MNSLVLSEINYKDFQKQENLFVIEQYYHDYLKQNDIKNEIHTLSPSFSKKSERILAMNECRLFINLC